MNEILCIEEKNCSEDIRIANFKAAIFDLDGTLLDSMDVWEKIDVERGLEVPDGYINDICARSFQEAAQYTIELFHLYENEEDIIKEWNDMAIYEYSHNVKLKPYAKEYLLHLKGKGVKLAIATGLPKKLYEPVLKNNGIFELFDVFCSTDEVGRGKEYPNVCECTGGCVLAGETTLKAAIREVKEELGVELDKCSGKMIYSERRDDSQDFYEAWLFHSQVNLSNLVLQTEEVVDARWMS